MSVWSNAMCVNASVNFWNMKEPDCVQSRLACDR